MRFLSLFLVSVVLLFTAGCVTSTPARKTAEKEMVARYEVAYANEAARAEAYDAALTHAVEKRLATELRIAVADRVEKGKSNPEKYPAADVSAEIARLYSVEESKRRQFNAAQNNFRTLKVKNEETNLKGARAIYSAIIQVDKTPPVDLSAAVNSALGVAPPNATLIDIPEPTK